MSTEMLKQTLAELLPRCDADDIGYLPLEDAPDELAKAAKEYLPTARALAVVLFRLPRGVMRGVEEGTTYYQYTAGGIVNLSETVMPSALWQLSLAIEDGGYTACPVFPNNITKPVDGIDEEHYPANQRTDGVTVDWKAAAALAGLGEVGLSGQLLTKRYGPFVRVCGIVTDAPLTRDDREAVRLCDNCGACQNACPGHAIGEKGVDKLRCAVYYRGMRRATNPFMPPDAFEDEPEMKALRKGEGEVSADKVEEILDRLSFYPGMRHGFAACICGRACDRACMAHLEETGRIESPARKVFRSREPWKLKD